MTKIKIVELEEEPTENGPTRLIVRVLSDGRYYKFLVNKKKYLVERTRKSYHRLWIKDIKEMQEEEADMKNTEKVKEDKIAVENLKGAEIEEEVWESG
jgi:ribosomal protein L24E